jgi:hypothetical protein
MPASGRAVISASDVTGKRADILVTGPKPAGEHRYCREPKTPAAGIELLILETNRQVVSTKLVLLH